MQSLNDTELLAAYVERRSDEAFATLVQRHISLVYSSALRQARDPHIAEEITQAVFMILARKAGSLRKETVLAGWLCRTAHFTARNALKAERRRQHREQEAHMDSLLNEPEPDTWPQVAPLLDEAVAQLGEEDRNALVLRFYEQRPLDEVGLRLGLSANATQKRVSRALDKVRKFFLKRGVVSTSALLSTMIAAHSVQAAPALLAQSATTLAVAKTTVASGSVVTLVKTTLVAMKTKTIAVAAAGMIVVAGAGVYIAETAGNKTSAAASDKVPMEFGNADFVNPAEGIGGMIPLLTNSSPDKFLNELDPDTRRTNGSAPAIHIKSLVPPVLPGSGDYLNSLPQYAGRGLVGARFMHYFVDEKSVLFGKRIRVTGWIKTRDVRNFAAISLMVLNMESRIFASDGMWDRPLSGTTGWQKVELVTDIPRESCFIQVGPTLFGPGEIWADDFQVEVVPVTEPVTDNRRWTVWSQCPNDYTETADTQVTRNGRSTLRIEYVSREKPHKYAFVWWGNTMTDPNLFKQYLGHTVRMSVWIKSENVHGNAGLNLQPMNEGKERIAQHSMFNRQQVKGTTDWKEYSVICQIPKETGSLQTGFFMFGPGKFWVDQSSFKMEIVK